jgi:hypothetical protein
MDAYTRLAALGKELSKLKSHAAKLERAEQFAKLIGWQPQEPTPAKTSRQAQWQAKQAHAGLCITCRSPRAHDSKWYCPTHRDAHRAARRARYKAKRTRS